MRVADVKIKMYVANDGTEFYSQRECEEYEKSLMPFVVKPEWIERHQKQVAENEKVKAIISEFMEQGKKYVLTDIFAMFFERMHHLHGFENTLIDLYEDRERLKIMADHIVDIQVKIKSEEDLDEPTSNEE